MNDPTMMPRTWHQAMRFLLDELPEVGLDAEPEDWSPEFAHLVALIHDGRGMELQELEDLAIKIERLRAAVARVEKAESEEEEFETA
jgi:hypothetical protein